MLRHPTSEEHNQIISLAHEIASTMPHACWYEVCQEAERLQPELARYAQWWDASVEALPSNTFEPYHFIASTAPLRTINAFQRSLVFNIQEAYTIHTCIPTIYDFDFMSNV